MADTDPAFFQPFLKRNLNDGEGTIAREEVRRIFDSYQPHYTACIESQRDRRLLRLRHLRIVFVALGLGLSISLAALLIENLLQTNAALTPIVSLFTHTAVADEAAKTADFLY